MIYRVIVRKNNKTVDKGNYVELTKLQQDHSLPVRPLDFSRGEVIVTQQDRTYTIFQAE